MSSKNIILIICFAAAFLTIAAIVFFFPSSKTAESYGILMFGHKQINFPGCYTQDYVPVMFYINTYENFSINEIDLNKFLPSNITKGLSLIHEIRSFKINNKNYLLMGFAPNKFMILSSENKLDFDKLKIELEDDLDTRLRAMDIGDVYGDGLKEIVVGTRPKGIVEIYKLVEGKWNGYQLTVLNETIHNLAIADTDGNGLNEIILTTSFTLEYPESKRIEPGRIIKFEFNKSNKSWNESVVWEFEKTMVNSTLISQHARYLFIDDFDQDGIKEIVANTKESPLTEQLIGPRNLESFKWNGSGYSKTAIENRLQINPNAVTFGDMDNDGKNEILAFTQAGDALLSYKFKDGKWEKSILFREAANDKESVVSVKIINQSESGYKKIFYVTSPRPDLVFADTNLYVLAYNPSKAEWEKSKIDEIPAKIYIWGIFSVPS